MNLTDEINDNWEYVWDCLADASCSSKELDEAYGKVNNKPDHIQISIVKDIINKVCTNNTHSGICHWGLSDTPVRDNIVEDIENKTEYVISILNKYLE